MILNKCFPVPKQNKIIFKFKLCLCINCLKKQSETKLKQKVKISTPGTLSASKRSEFDKKLESWTIFSSSDCSSSLMSAFSSAFLVPLNSSPFSTFPCKKLTVSRARIAARLGGRLLKSILLIKVNWTLVFQPH